MAANDAEYVKYATALVSAEEQLKNTQDNC